MMDFGDNYMAHLPNTNASHCGVAYHRQENRGLQPVTTNGHNPLMSGDQSMQTGEYFRLGGSGLNINDPRYAAKYGNPYLRDQRSSDMNGIRRGMISAGGEVDGAHISPLQSPHRVPSTMGGGGRQYATLNTRNGRPYSPNSALYRNNNLGYGTMQQKSTKNSHRERGMAPPNPGGSLLTDVLTENAKMVGSTTLHSASSAAAVANKYLGTMLGNGSISRPSNDNVSNVGTSNRPNRPQRILKPSSKDHNSQTINNDASSNGRMVGSQVIAENGRNGSNQDPNTGAESSHYILSPTGESANQAALATHV